MKKVLGFLFKIHKITGLSVVIFFSMWFLTGIVLVYHPYPKVSEKLLFSKKETLPSSLPELSSVLSKTDGEVKSLSLKQFQGQTLFSLDKAPDVTWCRYANIPTYRVIAGEEEFLVDASTDEIKSLQIPEETIVKGLKKIHGEEIEMKVSLLTEFDNYYLSRRVDLELPVYKIEVADANGSLYYVNPSTGYIRYLNNNKIVRKWLFNGIHYLDIDWLVARPWLWYTCIWLLCSGCLVVCISGLVLAWRVLTPKKKKRV